MHYPSDQRSSSKPHHHCHERRTRLHMRISCTSEVLSVRIHQEKPRPFRLASRSVAISVTVFSKERFSAVTHFLSLRRAFRCWRRRTAEEFRLRRMTRIRLFAVSPSCFDTRRKPISALAALVRFPVGPVAHEKFLSFFTKKEDLF